MSDRSSIEWTATIGPDGTVTPGASWNPIRVHRARPGTGPDGHHCLKLSPGCDHCYASALQPRYFGGAAYPAATTATIAAARASVEAGGVYLDRRTLEQPLHWRRPRRVFVCSMTDLFGEWVPLAWIAAIFAVMESAPQHTYQVLTKRPRLARAVLANGTAFYSGVVRKYGYDVLGSAYDARNPGWPLPNVWLGVTVESDGYAWRAGVLAHIPAAVRFVSAEPLLGPLPSLPLPIPCPSCGRPHLGSCDSPFRAIDWLIVGGESGSGARSMQPDWARDLRDRCQAAGVAFFFKQWGGATPKAGGRLLDGREHSEFPQALANITEEMTS